MATGGPIMNGDIPRSPSQPGTLEETLQQMNILIQENRDLKEALRQTNLTMKERFEGLAVWREKQQEERVFLESRLEDARVHMEALTLQNQELSSRKGEELKPSGATGGLLVRSVELDALRAQVARLQAEKNDLVALNSELQLKADQDSNDGSFIEIITVSVKRNTQTHRYINKMRRTHVEEATVSQLLQSLRNETQRSEQLQAELQSSAASEVENMKSQMMALFKELQQAQSKLDEAEGMKKNLQDRCRDVEQDVATLKAQLMEKQVVQSENDRLKLQLDSIQAQNRMEQRKAGEERYEAMSMDTLQREIEFYPPHHFFICFLKIYLEYSKLAEEMQQQLTAAEEALAAKQETIDRMKQEIFQKEKELETISVFQAQAEVYSSDFYAERAAREKLHEEKERLATQLEYIKKQNTQMQEEMDSLGRRSLNEMQRRHVPLGGSPHGAGPTIVGRGTDWQHQGNIPEHACPKCNEILPDLDSLQIHIMDCIN
uniref:Optineurin n=1 Tax=Mola mola TaxID=94237 RepID=A0A3Q3WFC4_MOLML